MALGRIESGTQTATADHALGSGSSTAGVYVCSWNLTAMTLSGVVRCYVKSKVLTGDTAEESWSGYFAGVDGGGDPIAQSDPIVNDGGFLVQCGVEEIGANSFSTPWALSRIAEY